MAENNSKKYRRTLEDTTPVYNEHITESERRKRKASALSVIGGV